MEWDHDHGNGFAAEGETYELIHGLIRAQKPEVVVETGTGFGDGARRIAAALDENGGGHLWTVDTHDTQPIPHRRITQVRARSRNFVRDFDRHIDFAFVDCAFGQERIEVVDWLLGRGTGLVVLHDLNALGLVPTTTPAVTLPMVRGLAIWQGRPA